MMDKFLQILDQREIDQFMLEAFSHDAYNRFDGVADLAIRQLQEANAKSGEDYNNFEKLKEADPEKWKELKIKADRSDIYLEGLVDGYMIDVISRTQEMVAMMEMKIIYAWKHLEIHIKKLIAAAYPGTDTTSFYHWQNLSAFLRSHGILIEELKGHAQIIQLQQVNNKAKHLDSIHEHLQHIPEFQNEGAISYESLANFYNRVKDAPGRFLHDLANAISKELYLFDEERLSAMAKSFALRMDSKTAKIFIEKLNELYQK